jgi:hypothetical protein
MTAWAPLCMSADEFAAWREMNGRITGRDRGSRPCDDCPLGFAAEMRAEGRCNGTPGGVEEEDEVEIRELKASQAGVVPVTVTVPCGRCVHREVCGIRAQIADLDRVETELPALNPALKPTLSMSIECGFYLAERKAKSTAPRSDAQIAAARANAEKMRAAKVARRANT